MTEQYRKCIIQRNFRSLEDATSFPLGPGRFTKPPTSPLALNRPDERHERPYSAKCELKLIPIALYDVEDNLNIIRLTDVPQLLGVIQTETEALDKISASVTKVFKQVGYCIFKLIVNLEDKNIILERLHADLCELITLTIQNLSIVSNCNGTRRCISKYVTMGEDAKKILKRMAKLCQLKKKAASNGRYIYQFALDLFSECVNDILPFELQ